jgi:L-fuculose-phosphate aldolase
MTHAAARTAIVAAARRMNAVGIHQGTSGNVSARIADGFLITPSGVPYDRMAPGDVVQLRSDGSGATPTDVRPSSEWRLHAGIYEARSDVLAIVHAHPISATALACLHREIPPFHYMVAVAGGSTIRCARYATFGTQALADAAVEALTDRLACLLANHGIVACGRTPDGALDLAIEVETLAAQYWHALQVGEPVLLDRQEMARVRERVRDYRSSSG